MFVSFCIHFLSCSFHFTSISSHFLSVSFKRCYAQTGPPVLLNHEETHSKRFSAHSNTECLNIGFKWGHMASTVSKNTFYLPVRRYKNVQKCNPAHESDDASGQAPMFLMERRLAFAQLNVFLAHGRHFYPITANGP